jgi:hypothetical protein
MLTVNQAEIVQIISGGTAFGVVAGAIIGVLVAAVLGVIRRRSVPTDVPYVALYAIAPSAAAGTLAGVITAIGTVIFGHPAWKVHFSLPDWTASLGILAVFLCAAVAAMRAMPDGKGQYNRWPLALGPIAWSLVGTLIGALAGVGSGFDGYFVLQSNEGPLRSAVVGAIIVGGSAFLWRLAVDRTARSLPPTTPATPRGGSVD